MRSSRLSPRVRRRVALSIAFLLGAFVLQSAVASTGQLTSTQALEPSHGRLLVKFDHGVPASDRARAITTAGGRAAGTIAGIDVNVVEAPAPALASVKSRLRASAGVKFVEPDALAHAFDTVPNDPWWASQWSAVKTSAPRAWDVTVGSAAAVVAVLDTGVDFAQPDLQGAFVPGYDAVFEDSDPADDDGHGTLATGVAGARGNNGVGVAGFCWRCSIMPVKALGTGGSGTLSDITQSIVWATDHGARVISMSWGYKGTNYSSLASAIKYAADRNVVLVAAAGNYGDTTPVYPAAYAEVIGVAGSDDADVLYSWSSRGSWVSVAAPGCNLSTGRTAWFGTFCGTSSAAPAVAGIAGLALSAAPGATATQIRAAIESSALPIGSVVRFGRVDAAKTIDALGGAPTGSAPANTSAPSIAGTAQVGQTLAGSPGSWSGSTPLAYGYQWQRCNSSGSGCLDIVGATVSSYAPVLADVNSTLRVSVTTSNTYGSSTASSTATALVTAAPTAPPVGGTSTASFSGSLNRKQPSRAFPLAVGSGMAQAALTFAKSPSLNLVVQRADGTVVGSASGSSVLPLIASLSAGDYSYVVSGGGANASFTLTVSYATP